MDLVKKHLASAVQEEIIQLKTYIKTLQDKCHRIEQENLYLKQHASPDTLNNLSLGVHLSRSATVGTNLNNTSNTSLTTTNNIILASFPSSAPNLISQSSDMQQQQQLVEPQSTNYSLPRAGVESRPTPMAPPTSLDNAYQQQQQPTTTTTSLNAETEQTANNEQQQQQSTNYLAQQQINTINENSNNANNNESNNNNNDN